ncbi:uncharacterized protein LOC143247296 isoform X2 [Tachypleus tridentatus]|uniref:uncharacterized protein LOC143247296 isoform X2 n=1 Tax=Tachypleus tridentatus TaxID=6853 RepID=UPI003FD2C2FD
MKSTLYYIVILGCFVRGITPSVCDIEQAVNETTTCSQQFKRSMTDKEAVIKENPETVCRNFCKLHSCHEDAMKNSSCGKEIEYFIESNIYIARAILQRVYKVNCLNYACVNPNTSLKVTVSPVCSIVIFLVYVFVSQNAFIHQFE